jgi:hypothetical protein
MANEKHNNRDHERQRAIDGSRLLLEALRDQHGEGGRSDLILNRREIRAEIARRLHARRVASTRSREV